MKQNIAIISQFLTPGTATRQRLLCQQISCVCEHWPWPQLHKLMQMCGEFILFQGNYGWGICYLLCLCYKVWWNLSFFLINLGTSPSPSPSPGVSSVSDTWKNQKLGKNQNAKSFHNLLHINILKFLPIFWYCGSHSWMLWITKENYSPLFNFNNCRTLKCYYSSVSNNIFDG